VILAQRLEKPLVAISFDRKVDAQMEQSGLAALRLDIRTFRAVDVYDRLARLLLDDGADASRTLSRYVVASQEQLWHQNATLLSLAGAGPGSA
jgi:polysaccharide pyruvyl transferase WcaK-like protein